MNEYIIEKYINKLTINHINEYAKNQNIKLINNENEIIYDFIKKNYKNLLKENYNEELIKDLKCSLSLNTYEKVNSLYKEAKEKIRM